MKIGSKVKIVVLEAGDKRAGCKIGKIGRIKDRFEPHGLSKGLAWVEFKIPLPSGDYQFPFYKYQLKEVRSK